MNSPMQCHLVPDYLLVLWEYHKAFRSPLNLLLRILGFVHLLRLYTESQILWSKASLPLTKSKVNSHMTRTCQQILKVLRGLSSVTQITLPKCNQQNILWKLKLSCLDKNYNRTGKNKIRKWEKGRPEDDYFKVINVRGQVHEK